MSELVSLADAEARATDILGNDGSTELLNLLRYGDIIATAGRYVVQGPGGFCLETIEEKRNFAMPSWFWEEFEAVIEVDCEAKFVFEAGYYEVRKYESVDPKSSENEIRVYEAYDVYVDMEYLQALIHDSKYIKAPVEGVYISPFISVMLDAARQFGLKPDMKRPPKKDELINFFKDRTLADGTVISANHAQYLATFCRPPEAMKGGNKPMG